MEAPKRQYDGKDGDRLRRWNRDEGPGQASVKAAQQRRHAQAEMVRPKENKSWCSCVNVKHKRQCSNEAKHRCHECDEPLCPSCYRGHHAHWPPPNFKATRIDAKESQ